MAIQHICDRCGAVINPTRSATRIAFDNECPGRSNTDERYELCVSCAFHLKNWLENKEKEKECANG